MNVVIETGHLFRPLAHALLHLLRGLPREGWSRPATPGGWTVADVAAHLLDGDLRRISVDRDGHRPPGPQQAIDGYADLLAYLNALNHHWVTASRRLSPEVLVDLLEASTSQAARVLKGIDPTGTATYPVAWAGAHADAAWLDVGREFTERWHHQDQIRRAVEAPALDDPDFLEPALAISLLALPRAYDSLVVPTGTCVGLEASGAVQRRWTLVRGTDGWSLGSVGAYESDPDCRISAPALDLTRLLLNSLTAEEVETRFSVAGDTSLFQPLKIARALMVQSP